MISLWKFALTNQPNILCKIRAEFPAPSQSPQPEDGSHFQRIRADYSSEYLQINEKKVDPNKLFFISAVEAGYSNKQYRKSIAYGISMHSLERLVANKTSKSKTTRSLICKKSRIQEIQRTEKMRCSSQQPMQPQTYGKRHFACPFQQYAGIRFWKHRTQVNEQILCGKPELEKEDQIVYMIPNSICPYFYLVLTERKNVTPFELNEYYVVFRGASSSCIVEPGWE